MRADDEHVFDGVRRLTYVMQIEKLRERTRHLQFGGKKA